MYKRRVAVRVPAHSHDDAAAPIERQARFAGKRVAREREKRARSRPLGERPIVTLQGFGPRFDSGREMLLFGSWEDVGALCTSRDTTKTNDRKGHKLLHISPHDGKTL